uniref:Cell division protein n=1 Tax=Chaetophoropsis polyrhiza TaxID=2079440 RepID=A0A6H1U8A2_9CHLO|nr:cell division protein [Chaetophoropsis polyrhiza]QIZ74263.1 cell division protein [Chaetophoropsis polyrhiza]
MFNYSYSLIKNTKLLLPLTNVKNKKVLIHNCFQFSMKHINQVQHLNTKSFYYNKKKIQKQYSVYSYLEFQKKNRQEKSPLNSIVRNPAIDWHCTKPLGKNELGLWFSLITQPFSTRKHWWILLPAQNLLFRLRWERFQARDFRSAQIPTVTSSLNWFSEKPIYFYVVIPFLGCLGLIYSTLPNDLRELKRRKDPIFCVDGHQSKIVSTDLGNPSDFQAEINFGNPSVAKSEGFCNRTEVRAEKTLSQVSSNWSYAGQHHYVATYFDSQSYFKYLNCSNLVQNLNLDVFTGCVNNKSHLKQVFPDHNSENKNVKSDLHNSQEFLSKKKQSAFSPPFGTWWEQYLLQKSKIDWFWSQWALKDFSLLNEKTGVRLIWEKLNSSTVYKINCEGKNNSEPAFSKGLLVKKNNNTSFSFYHLGKAKKNDFAQKLFSTDLHFPTKILTNIKRSNQTTDSIFTQNQNNYPSKFAGKSEWQRKGTWSLFAKRFPSRLSKSSLFEKTGTFGFQQIETLKNSSGNFILISGLQKNSLFNFFETDFHDLEHRSVGKSGGEKGQSPFQVTQQDDELKKKEFYNLFGFVHLNKSYRFQNALTWTKMLPERISDLKYFTTAFFLDNLFTKFYSYKQFQFLNSYFTSESYRIQKTLDAKSKFYKLNFPILFSGYKIDSSNKKSDIWSQCLKSNKKLNYKIELSTYSRNYSISPESRTFFENVVNQSESHLINTFISNNTKNKSYSTNCKWQSVGNWSFYWNYFKHFYGSSGLLKPWTSTFDSIMVQKPAKNLISNILLKKFYNPFPSVNFFPDKNFLFTKWHSKKKQGFFYKRITKLQLKKRTSQTSYSRIVSLLWGFRAKYKLDEVLQYQKSKYYQSKKAQQTAHQNFNQNTTSTNINYQMVLKTLTKRRRYKKYIEFNTLSSWLRDVLYFKKIGRKLVKIKKDTYLFNYANLTTSVPEVSKLFYRDSIESKVGQKYPLLNQQNIAFLRNIKNRGSLSQSSVSKSYKKYQVFPVPRYAKKFPSVSTLFPQDSGKTTEKGFISTVPDSLYIKKSTKNNFDFQMHFFNSQSLHTSKTLFMTLKKFNRLNKNHQLNQYWKSFKIKRFSTDRVNGSHLQAEIDSFCLGNSPYFRGLEAKKKGNPSVAKPEGFCHRTDFLAKNQFGTSYGTGYMPYSFSVNKTPIVLKKIALKSLNNRLLQPYRNTQIKYGFLSRNDLCKTLSVAKIFKNFNRFFYNFQKNLKNKFFSKLPLSYSVKKIKPIQTNLGRKLFSLSFDQSVTKPNAHLFVQKKISKKENLATSRYVGLHKSSGKVMCEKQSLSQLSTKLKTNIRISLLNKLSHFSPSLYKPFQLASPSSIEKREIQPLVSVEKKSSDRIAVNFLSLDELIFKFKNLSSSFVIWRNKFQIRRDYLLLSYMYLDYLGTLINSFTNSYDFFLNFVDSNDYKNSTTLSANFEIKSNYFVKCDRYKTNLIKPCWSFSIINHLKINHMGISDQLLTASNHIAESEYDYLNSFSTEIFNFGVLPRNSLTSFINSRKINSSVLFNRSCAKNLRGSRFFETGKQDKLIQFEKTKLFSFLDSTTFNKNYLNYKTKLFNQKLILLKKQKLISAFNKGPKTINLTVKKQSNFKQTIQWTKLKYRRKPGISKSRIGSKETKIYNGLLFQNLGFHSERFENISVQNFTFWLCTIVFHICLLSSLIRNYKVSFHFCFKTLYSFVFILNKYFVYAKYRFQRLINYIYRNNLEPVIENLPWVSGSKRETKKERYWAPLAIFNKMNNEALQSSDLVSPFLGTLKITQNTTPLNTFSSQLHKPGQLLYEPSSEFISVKKNSFSKLFFLPSFYANTKTYKDSNFIFSVDNKYKSLLFSHSFNRFRMKILTLLQYIQFKYHTPFSNFQFDSKQLDKSFGQAKISDQSKGIIPISLTKAMSLLENFKGVSTKVDFKKLQIDSNFQVQRTTINKNLLQGSLVSLQTNKSIGSTSEIGDLTFNDFGNRSDFRAEKIQNVKKIPNNNISEPFGRILNFLKSKKETNIKFYLKVLKWNMLLTLLIGESEVLAELEPYREMHWYFLKKFPIFLRTSATKDYLSMSDYQADEKIRIIKQKIRQTIMILYLRTKKYESKLQNRVTQNEKTTNSLVRNRVNKKKLIANKNDLSTSKLSQFGSETSDTSQSGLSQSKLFRFFYQLDFFRVFTDNKIRRRKIKKLAFWKSILTFLGKYSFLSRSAILSKRFRESLLMFSSPLVVFGPLGTIFLTYGLKKFILGFEQNYYQKSKTRLASNHLRQMKENSEKALDTNLFSLFLRASQNKDLFSAPFQKPEAFHFANKGFPRSDEVLKLNSYILQKITNQIKFEQRTLINGRNIGVLHKSTEQFPKSSGDQLGFQKELIKLQTNNESFFDLEFFIDSQKFLKKYTRIYSRVTNPLDKTLSKSKLQSRNYSIFPIFLAESEKIRLQYKKNLINSSLENTSSSKNMQILKLSDLYNWSYTEKSNTLGKNSIYADTFDPKLRYYRFSTNFSKLLADVGGFYTNISAQQEIGPIICKVYTGLFAKQSAKNYLVVSGSTNQESVLLLIQALSAEMGMKLFIEDAKRLQRIGRRGINKATKRLEKLFDIAQANTPALVFIEDIHVIGAKTKMIKVDEEHDDIEILSRSLLSKLVYRKYHRNKSLRESFIDQNLFTGGSSSTRRRSLKPSNPIPTSLVLYQLTRRRALANFFKSQENPARRLNNKLFLSKKLSPAFTTNAVLIWKLFKSKIATPNKRIKETPWYHIPVDAMRSINPLTYSIRVKVAKITLLAIFTMGTRLRLVKDLIRLFEKIQFESYQNLIVFATTNKLSTLDPNLRRPGRLEETISLEGLTGTVSSSRSPAFMAILDTFKVHLKNVPGFSKTFNIIDNTLFSTNLNLHEWTVINYLAENAYYSFDSFKNNCEVTNVTPFEFSITNSNYSNKIFNFMLFSDKERKKRLLFPIRPVGCQIRRILPGKIFEPKKLKTPNIKVLRLSQNQRMTNFSLKNPINSPFSLFATQNSGVNNIASYWQSLFSNILLQKKTGLFTFNYILNFYKIDKFNLFVIFAYSRSGQSLVSFFYSNRSDLGPKKSQNYSHLDGFSQATDLVNSSDLQAEIGTISESDKKTNHLVAKSGEFCYRVGQNKSDRLQKNKMVVTQAKYLRFDSDYLINLQLWPEMVNLMSLKKSNIFSKRKQNGIPQGDLHLGDLHSSFVRFFASKVGELIFGNSVIWTKPKLKENFNTTFFNSIQNTFIMYPNRGLSNIYNTKASWSGAYASIKNVVTTSALYSKTPLLSKLLHLEDLSKPRQKPFFESLNAGMLFEYSDFHYRAFFKKNNFSTEENLNLLIYQKYMLNNQGRPLRKYVKLEHSNRLWLFRILYTELGSLDNLTLNPTSMNYYYRNKIALKQVFKFSSYQWWNWHLRKPVEQLEDIQEIAYFPCENKYYTPRRRRWILTNGFWGYWFSFDKNFYFELYEQYMLQSLHFACLQLDKNREVLDYLAKLYICKEKLSETDIIFALKRYQI